MSFEIRFADTDRETKLKERGRDFMEKMEVVIVEDHEQMRKMLMELVESDDSMEVAGVAEDGAEACELIRKLEPDVVLLDLIMPVLDGLGVLEQMRNTRFSERTPKFIVVSAVSEENMVGEAFRLGASYYVIKPFVPEVLISRMKAVMNTEKKEFCQIRRISPYEDILSVERREMESKIAEILHKVGVPAHIRGYIYLKEAILLALMDVEMIQSVTRKLYPAIAEKFETTGSRVERSIRHAIESAWDRGEAGEKEELFGYTIHKSKGKPTNSEFIALITDKLKMDFGW